MYKCNISSTKDVYKSNISSTKDMCQCNISSTKDMCQCNINSTKDMCHCNISSTKFYLSNKQWVLLFTYFPFWSNFHFSSNPYIFALYLCMESLTYLHWLFLSVVLRKSCFDWFQATLFYVPTVVLLIEPFQTVR